MPAPSFFPADRELVYPFLQLEYGENRFATAFNLDELYRTEDLYLGQQLLVRVGYASKEFGSDQNRVVLEGRYSSTLVFDGRQFWQHSVSWEALLNNYSGNSEDLLVSYSNRYFFRHFLPVTTPATQTILAVKGRSIWVAIAVPGHSTTGYR